MFSFDKLITPKIITALYIITVLFLLLIAGVNLTHGVNAASIICILAALFSRIFFECVMVSFKNNEYLRRIAEALEKQ